MDYKSIFISDIHLGTKRCQAKLLLNFLKYNKCETLYLLGDIIDGWKIQRNKFDFDQDHLDVSKKLLGLSKKIDIYYIIGNHDEFFKAIIPYHNELGNIKIFETYEYLALDGKKYLLAHGDMFDGIQSVSKYLSFLGDKGYDFILELNGKFNWLLRKFGFRYWSLSKYLKLKVKKAMSFIYEYEQNITSYCKRKGLDGVICGHIHHPEIKTINDLAYMNCGDWVESCTALVETFDGKWRIVEWKEKIK